MEIWLRLVAGEDPVDDGMVDRYWSETEGHVNTQDGVLKGPDGVMGAHVVVADGHSQQEGVAFIGTVDWILVECETWSMIPLENLISARTGSHTKIAAVITTPVQAQGAGFALQEGVDALVIPNDSAMLEAASSVKAQRSEKVDKEVFQPTEEEDLVLVPMTVTAVEQAGVGDRYCLDFLSLFSQGEGILVGSSAASLVLVHSETIPSTFVPTRPFRVNAGAPHSYVLMADGSTKYIAELVSGDEVLAVSAEGVSRRVILGRSKIEQRPMLKISYVLRENIGRKANESHVYLQQAETVRLLTDLPEACSVTELKVSQAVLGWTAYGARHLGQPIGGHVEER